MKKMKAVLLGTAAILACGGVLSGCATAAEVVAGVTYFGEFAYNGIKLVEYAVNTISANDAKNIVENNEKDKSQDATPAEFGRYVVSARNEEAPTEPGEGEGEEPQPEVKLELPKLSKEMQSKVAERYGGVVITTKYYEEGNDEQQAVSHQLIGKDFFAVLEENKVAPYLQLVAQNVIITEDIISYMDARNQQFTEEEQDHFSPFPSIYTYHKDANDNLVIHTRRYEEIPSSEAGGIGSNFRQDSEVIYDSTNKMSKWQTSLGIYIATPHGTMKIGYILEVEFNWLAKET